MENVIKDIELYWNQQPCNVKHSQNPIGTKQYWSDVDHRRWYIAPHLKKLSDFPKWKNLRVLELGCGIGADAEQFVRHGAKYVGIDLSGTSIDLCRQRFEVQDLKGEFHHMDAADWNQVSKLGTFDLVYACGVLHHYPDPEKIVSNVHRVLDQNGEFRFLVYAKNSWKWAMIMQGLDQFEAQANCPWAVVYTPDEIKLLLQHKFDLVAIDQDYCFMYNVDKYKQGIYELEPWFAAMTAQHREAIRKNLGWHLSVISKKS